MSITGTSGTGSFGFYRIHRKKHGLIDREVQNLKEAQLIVMKHVWDNEEDEAWNEHPSR